MGDFVLRSPTDADKQVSVRETGEFQITGVRDTGKFLITGVQDDGDSR